MSVTIAPIPSAVYTALGNFIVGVTGLPTTSVIRGIDNRVPEPPKSGYIAMTGLFQIPLATNQDDWDETNPNPLTLTIERDTQFNIQVDAYGPSADQWAPELSILLRDDYGCIQLAPNCQPLYGSEARMLPLEDAEMQYEQRWSFDAVIQYNPVVTVPMNFANSLSRGIIDVNTTYPP